MYLIINNDNVVGEFEDYNKILEDIVAEVKDSDSLCPLYQFVKDIEYNIQENRISDTVSEYNIVKIEKIHNKGYIYSTMSSKSTVLNNIIIYSIKKSIQSNESLEVKLLDKINERVIRNLGRDSLVQILLNFKNAKDIHELSSLLENHKKKSYSAVAEKLKRFGTK